MLLSRKLTGKTGRAIFFESNYFKCYRKCSSSTNKSQTTMNISRNASFPAIKSQLSELKKQTQPQSFGQPTPETHPHLLKKSEVVTEITVDELICRRNKLLELIEKVSSSMNKEIKNSIVVVPSAVKRYMSEKIPYVFRQNSDFFYYSGCLEPDSILVMTINEQHVTKSILFMRPKDKHAELWDGPRTGIPNSMILFGVDEAYPVKEFSTYITNYLNSIENKNQFGFWFDSKGSTQQDVTNIVNTSLTETGIKPAIRESPLIYFHQMRLIKSPAEINLMRATCEIGAKSINKTIAESKPGDSEHHLFARVDYHSRMNNANYLAYPPVVAGGNNATTIHYINNCQVIKDGELVLMDAGCEYGGYSSDITRTWPINGQFSDVQRVLYEVILTLQKELIGTLQKDGGHTLDELFDTMCLRLGFYLQEVGLLRKGLSHAELAKMAYSFCPHHVSHYLGMDVHDTPLISRSIKLIPGMVCTVEPGIYIAADRQDVPPEFRGIGIRIEDDVLINENSVEVLTEKCAKDIEEIVKLIKI